MADETRPLTDAELLAHVTGLPPMVRRVAEVDYKALLAKYIRCARSAVDLEDCRREEFTDTEWAELQRLASKEPR